MVFQKNITLLRVLFITLLGILFFASCKSKKSVTTTNTKNPNEEKISSTPKKNTSAIQQKYATQLNVEAKILKNEKLYTFIDEWYGAPYKYAGFDKSGIDCSGFACKLYQNVYNQKTFRSTKDLYANCKEVKISDLKEGDFVFFKIEKPTVSHVGVYLINNKFVHASTKKGIIINDLNEPYYKKYFLSGGRLK